MRRVCQNCGHAQAAQHMHAGCRQPAGPACVPPVQPPWGCCNTCVVPAAASGTPDRQKVSMSALKGKNKNGCVRGTWAAVKVRSPGYSTCAVCPRHVWAVHSIQSCATSHMCGDVRPPYHATRSDTLPTQHMGRGRGSWERQSARARNAACVHAGVCAHMQGVWRTRLPTREHQPIMQRAQLTDLLAAIVPIMMQRYQRYGCSTFSKQRRGSARSGGVAPDRS
jgi:hypothetical protein